jgi:hypothetical protein
MNRCTGTSRDMCSSHTVRLDPAAHPAALLATQLLCQQSKQPQYSVSALVPVLGHCQHWQGGGVPAWDSKAVLPDGGWW